ncbi:hypothetical protein [Gemella cuniculi]|uniref:hypothetical protein n=1 Tax=Gemella cuniculi TaxID=150240 RepID=UPI0003F4B56B|nr:hypothetical protein [Gemella cuniculi]
MNKKIIGTILSASLLMIPLTTNNTLAKDNIIKTITNSDVIAEYAIHGPSIPDGGGGSYGIYKDVTRIGAPWTILPKSLYIQEWHNGKTIQRNFVSYVYYSI